MFSPSLSEYERALVPLNSEKGQIFAAHLSDAALPRLCAASDSYEAQSEPSWCGMAAIRMGLRTLSALFPDRLSHDVANAFTQDVICSIEQQARGQPSTARGLRAGLSLAEAAALLADLGLHGILHVRLRSAADAKFEAGASLDLAAADQVMLVNVLRQVRGQSTGHWMVVCATTHVNGDTWALILDPAANKLGPHWLPEAMLLSSMATLNYRGEGESALSKKPLRCVSRISLTCTVCLSIRTAFARSARGYLALSLVDATPAVPPLNASQSVGAARSERDPQFG